MVKIIGDEWNRFYNDDSLWKDGMFYDDAEIKVNGIDLSSSDADISNLPIDAIIELKGGYLEDDFGSKSYSMETMFKRWKKSQVTIYFSIEGTPENLKLIEKLKESKGVKFL